MDSRKHIMLSFQYEENWIGGTYYILNIIRALNLLNDADKPRLTILHNPQTSTKEVEQIGYPYLNFLAFEGKMPGVFKKINQLAHLILHKPVFKIRIPGDRIENFYPAMQALDRSNIAKTYAWIPDFQEHYLPQYFSRYERIVRKVYHKAVVKSKIPVVFSSKSALADFNKFYPENKNVKAVLPFVSILNHKYDQLSIDSLRAKYQIHHPYFIVTNQFWKHKDHLTVIKAFEALVQTNPGIQLVLTGKEHDYRNPEYPAYLKNYVVEKGLKDKILFLGFIDRNEQLKLMKESLAIIQPSLFEGWSTVVEDAKSLGKFIILSSIVVHKEQISDNCMFFEPSDSGDLLAKLRAFLKEKPAFVEYDYQNTIKNFGRSFLSLFN